MDFTRYTNRAQQAALKAQSIATEYHHTSIEPAHVFLSLMEQEDGLAPRIIQKIGAGTAAIQAELGANLRDMPRASHPPSGAVSSYRALSERPKYGERNAPIRAIPSPGLHRTRRILAKS